MVLVLVLGWDVSWLRSGDWASGSCCVGGGVGQVMYRVGTGSGIDMGSFIGTMSRSSTSECLPAWPFCFP